MFSLLGRDEPWPTVFHVTHYKAGSQWVFKIFRWLAPNRVITPRYESRHFLDDPIRQGKVYPTLYLTREQFEAVSIPEDSRRLVVIRDLRDTLVSLYFSWAFSHQSDDVVRQVRPELQAMSRDDGLAWLTEHPAFGHIADIQRSWVISGEPVIRYEDLLEQDEEIFDRLLIDDFRLPVTHEEVRSAVRSCRFEAMTGRRRGREDPQAHERKGVAGDWRNYFTDRVSRAFSDRYGALTEAAGYQP
jgi:lipopolysaccharide transport system ATP-binding protein